MSERTGAAVVATFQQERRRLFAVAYRMLGSIADAEDVLQDAYVRWEGAAHGTIRNPGAWLVQTVTRLCLDALRSAHARRMEYVGPWLPEPILARLHDGPDDADLASLGDELSLALLVMLERLPPVERAVFLLRESFGFAYAEIAEIVGRSEAHCRQLHRRARSHVSDAERASHAVRTVDRAEHERLVSRFLAATRDGDVEGLVGLLADDVVTWSDGGSKVHAARRPVTGLPQVVRFLSKLREKAPPGTRFELARVNGEPGLLTWVGDYLVQAMAFGVEGGRIRRIYVVVNPDKLHLDGALVLSAGWRLGDPAP